MSSENKSENGADNTLMSLDQLSDTIEVMTGVVKRLKRHLHQQLSLQAQGGEATALNQALLSNERELRELQELARAQRLSMSTSLPDVEAPSGAETAEGEQSQDAPQSFIVEISRADDDDLTADRVLH